MGVFHIFKIVQMVPNRATHRICLKVYLEYLVPVFGKHDKVNKIYFYSEKVFF